MSHEERSSDGSCQEPVKWHGAAAKFSQEAICQHYVSERAAGVCASAQPFSAQEAKTLWLCNDLAAIHAAVSVLVLTIFPRSALTVLIARCGLAADLEHIGHVFYPARPSSAKCRRRDVLPVPLGLHRTTTLGLLRSASGSA